jgi:hypothetical protein
LLNPLHDFVESGTFFWALLCGHFEPQDLPMEHCWGKLGELDGGADARVEQQAAVLAADGGNARQICQGKPFVDVVNVNLHLSGEGLPLVWSLGGFKKLLGGGNAKLG